MFECKNINIDISSLQYSAIGLLCWIISEVFCNKLFFIGHAIWHVMFPLGFIIFINNLDKAIIQKQLGHDLNIF